MTGCAVEVLHCSTLLGTVAVSNNRAVCLELLCNQLRGTEHCLPTIETATRFTLTRSKEAAVWFSRKPKCLPLPLQNVCLCLPLLIPIDYKSRIPLLRRTEVGGKKWRYCEGGRSGFCSSPAGSLLIMLRTNMKHTHATASSHTSDIH